MTSFATPRIICCPCCGKFLKQRRLASFNDFGAIEWSDGYSSIWSLIAVSPIGHCPWCHGVFWYEDAEEVGILPREPVKMGWLIRLITRMTGDKRGDFEKERIWNETPDEWKGARDTDLPSFRDWLTALENRSSLTPQRELLVRRKIWWEGNDSKRQDHDGTWWKSQVVLTEEEVKENLEAMLRLHASLSDPMLLEKSEILRALGRFEEAIAVIEKIDVSQWDSEDSRYLRAAKILAYARNSDSQVHEVWSSDEFYKDTTNIQEGFMANPPPCGDVVEFRMSNAENGLVSSIYWFNASDVQAAAEKMVEINPRMVGLRGAARWASCRDSSNPSPSQVPPILITFHNIAYGLIQSGIGQVSCPVCCKTYSASELVDGFRKNGGFVYEIFSCPAQHELINIYKRHQ